MAGASRVTSGVSRRSTGPRRRRRPDPAEDSALIDFFGHLSLLLVAVRAGDLGRAQAAADALALDALVELSAGMGAGGLAALLGDLVSHLATPILRDDDAGLAAARALADDLHAATSDTPAPDPYADDVDDGQAAYDTLAHYREGDPGAV